MQPDPLPKRTDSIRSIEFMVKLPAIPIRKEITPQTTPMMSMVLEIICPLSSISNLIRYATEIR
jgi:hypothetical protein